MEKACPTPIPTVEDEICHPRSVGGFSAPIYHSRPRLTKGFTCRRPPLSKSGSRENALTPPNNIRGTKLLPRRSPVEYIGIVAAPRETSLVTSRDSEVQRTVDGGSLYESGGEDDTDSIKYCLSVNGRNPVLSESNVVDWKRPITMEVPIKAVSAEHQSYTFSRLKPPRVQIYGVLPTKTLNIDGLGLPYSAEQMNQSYKDYKPGRIANTSLNCFRCENRMSAHDAHEWFESILISSRFRGEKDKDKTKRKNRKYSKAEISRALFPRYWSKECMSPDPTPRGPLKTPDTRPPTQTPDTISGPWRAENSRADSRDGIILTREDLKGFCGGHEKSQCSSDIKHESPLTPCRQYFSDTQISTNFITGGEIWCHSADTRVESCPVTDRQIAKSTSQNKMPKMTRTGNTSRLSVQSNDSHPPGRLSALEFRMRCHCGANENVCYELHESQDTQVDKQWSNDEVPLVKTPLSVISTGEPNCEENQGEVDAYTLMDNRRCFSMTDVTSSCRFNSIVNEARGEGCTTAGQQGHLKCHCVSKSFPCHNCSFIATNCDTGRVTHLSQIDCNTSAVENVLSSEVKENKTSSRMTTKDVGNSLLLDLVQQESEDQELDEYTQHCENEPDTSLEKIITDDRYYGKYMEECEVGFQDRNQIEQQDEDDEEEGDDFDEEEQLQDERYSNFFRNICEGRISRNESNQMFPDLPKPLGRSFCYVPIVDKRYNRWKRRKPKKHKKSNVKVRHATRKTTSSTSNDSQGQTEGGHIKRNNDCSKKEAQPRGRISRQVSRNEHRDVAQELQQEKEQQRFQQQYEQEEQQRFQQQEQQQYQEHEQQQYQEQEHESINSKNSPQLDPNFDRSDSAEETQFPDSTEADTDPSKSSLASSGTRTSPEIPRRDSSISQNQAIQKDILDPENTPDTLSESPVMKSPEVMMTPEQITAQTRARSRVASIPSKNYPRTQKSLLSLSLRGPAVEKELTSMDPMKPLPRVGGGLPLLKTQRSLLARRPDSAFACHPRDTSYISKMDRRLGWIKRGIMQKNGNHTFFSLPNTELKLAAEKYTTSSPPKSAVPKTRVPKISTKNRTRIPRHSKAPNVETFSSIIQGQKKQGSSKRRVEGQKARGRGAKVPYYKSEDDDDLQTFTLGQLLSNLPDSSDFCTYESFRSRRSSSPTKMANFFNNFVKGSPLHKRRTQHSQIQRQISALSFTRAFTFSIYALPQVYRNRNRNVTLNNAWK